MDASANELAQEVENQLLLALNPPDTLCLDPSPRVAQANALKRINTGYLQANVWNRRSHYFFMDQVRYSLRGLLSIDM
jgi:hypothetical protein